MSLLVYGHHRVKDYATWRPFFDQDDARRLSYGIKTLRIMCREDDPNDIHFVFQVESKERLLECMNVPEFGPILEQAGVLEKPEMIFFKGLYANLT